MYEVNIVKTINIVNSWNYKIQLFLYYLFLCFNRQKKTHAGWVIWSYIMLEHNEKLDLVIELIRSGVIEADDIIHNIKKLDQELFKSEEG